MAYGRVFLAMGTGDGDGPLKERREVNKFFQITNRQFGLLFQDDVGRATVIQVFNLKAAVEGINKCLIEIPGIGHHFASLECFFLREYFTRDSTTRLR